MDSLGELGSMPCAYHPCKFTSTHYCSFFYSCGAPTDGLLVLFWEQVGGILGAVLVAPYCNIIAVSQSACNSDKDADFCLFPLSSSLELLQERSLLLVDASSHGQGLWVSKKPVLPIYRR